MEAKVVQIHPLGTNHFSELAPYRGSPRLEGIYRAKVRPYQTGRDPDAEAAHLTFTRCGERPLPPV